MTATEDIAAVQSAQSDEVLIQISGMHKWFASFHVLKDINLAVYKGERIVVCGPSGSGKSTMIRCINALEPFQRGTVNVEQHHLRAHAKGAGDGDTLLLTTGELSWELVCLLRNLDSGQVLHGDLFRVGLGHFADPDGS